MAYLEPASVRSSPSRVASWGEGATTVSLSPAANTVLLAAEKRAEVIELERAMLTDLDDTEHLRSLLGAFESWRVVSHPNGTLFLSGHGLERPEAVRAPPPLDDVPRAVARVKALFEESAAPRAEQIPQSVAIASARPVDPQAEAAAS
jgi:hypothetical protein